ncbi:MAG TPA: lytic murein transglycosylase [Gammaproteobacteria bacterium]|nr:lytic murein transglycosylase [Gammaproteobacteria bacterium]
MVSQALKSFILISILFLTGCVSSNFGNRPDVQAFIQHVSQKDNFNQSDLTTLFNQVHPRPVYVHKENHAAERTASWEHYRAIFMTRSRIHAGRVFWREHQAALNQAQQEYGVDPAVIIGILGVETEYGEYMGKYRVIDSLSTLAFNYPSREPYFRGELEQYLLLTRELHKNPLDLYGSYAGAMGYPQFMPTAYRTLAVSQTPNQLPDLFNNPDDAILSIANYFHNKGWIPNKRPAVPLRSHQRHAVLFGNQYWHLYHNFEVIKRYNNSDYYAMAVYQLGQKIQQGL